MRLDLTSLEQRWLGERWMVQNGIMPDSAADTILMYAYLEKEVQSAKIEFNHASNPPVVTVAITFTPWKKRLYNAAMSRRGLWSKLVAIGAILFGAPIRVETAILKRLKDYLGGSGVDLEVRVD